MKEPTPGARGGRGGLPARVRRIVMIGFMGAGKSTVGRMLADALGWRFVDLDDEVARRDGMPVDRIIRQKGLDHFRRRESEVGRELLRRVRTVVSVGGGWPAQPGHMESLDRESVSIWLQVGVASALERIAGSTSGRPLLEASDPVGTATALLDDREPYYRRGSIAIETEGVSPNRVLRAILSSLTVPKSGNGSVPARIEQPREDIE